MARLTREEWLEYQEEKGYKSYERWYERQEAIAERHGETMKSRMLDYDEWLTLRNELREDFKKEVEAGTRKGIGNVNQYIARSQAYDVSYASALNIREALKERGEEFGEGADKITVYGIMSRSEEAKEAIFDILDEQYHKLKEEEIAARGLKGHKLTREQSKEIIASVRKEISRRYFGSP